ncbi:MFS transporter [Citricoccus muralis]|uniref:MFS transporter n=1 Tax=Citricoccus muralis TaxID=169134 RepID=A0ABY8H655_9MICC|nr:MFS transporter [Citricoccus muralis]WFP16137.1 MFS transporter [Citricoccus muralis]
MRRAPLRPEVGVAFTAAAAFACFFGVYPSAALILSSGSVAPGTLVAVLMAVVVLIQPVIVWAGRWLTPRVRAVRLGLALMVAGAVALPWLDHWPGIVLFGAGFGVFVISCTSWAKEVVAPERIAPALALFGFANAVGGLIGGPLGMLLVTQVGPGGTLTMAGIASGLGLAATTLVRVPAGTAELQVGSGHDAGEALQAADVGDTDDAASSTERRGRPVSRSPLLWLSSVALTGHLIAVTCYAVALSSMSVLALTSAAWVVVLATATTQFSVALGRLATGAVIDHVSARVLAGAALAVLAVGSAWFMVGSGPATVMIAAALIGAASGIVQTTVLTVLMRRAHTRLQTDRMSAAWNIIFDVGLGLGAALVSVLTLA